MIQEYRKLAEIHAFMHAIHICHGKHGKSSNRDYQEACDDIASSLEACISRISRDRSDEPDSSNDLQNPATVPHRGTLGTTP